MNYERFIAIGNATKDAQAHQTREGDRMFATFGLAVNKAKDEANFYEVVIFDASAPTAVEKIKKGDTVFVDGSLNLRTWNTNQGEPRTQMQIQAEQWRKL